MIMSGTSTAPSTSTTAAETVPCTSYHRGDPLDIPLIDGHLLTHLLLPRITSAIRLAFPQVHLDWTTGVASRTPSHSNSSGSSNNDGGQNNDDVNTNNSNTLVWKRIVEGVLRTCLLLGSCHHIYKNSQARDVILRTPAMQSLGMFLQPRSRSSHGMQHKHNHAGTMIQSRIQMYGKVIALVLATVILPSLYEELKYRRQRQLEEREQRLRMEDIRREFRTFIVGSGSGSSSPQQQSQSRWQSQQQHTTQLRQQHNNSSSNRIVVEQRAHERKSFLQTLVTDTILGMGDVLLPPLRLISYISYLWGINSSISTPSLGMWIVGWEYASSSSPSLGGDHDDHSDGFASGAVAGQRYQRHANFQYGNRRLMVEEALRTMSAILPPRNTNGVAAEGVGTGAVGDDITRNSPGVNRRINLRGSNDYESTNSPRTRVSSREREDERDGSVTRVGMLCRMARRSVGVGKRSGWIRNRFLSFMGVVEEDGENNNESTMQDDGRRYTLTCSMCHVENPTIPYIASCGHCYCYLCLRMAVTDDLSFRCVDCGEWIVSSGRPKTRSRVPSSS